MYRIHRSIDISFSHHVRGHTGACVNLHGHTWKFEVGLQAPTLDAEGFVLDFGRLSSEVLRPAHRLLDHALAVGSETYAEVEAALVPLGEQLYASRRIVHGDAARFDDDRTSLELAGAFNRFPGGLKVCVFPFNPSSERLAEWLYGLASRLADDRVSVAYARIYETLHPVESVAEYRTE
jgi:6-pyruvoyltetrahydropterin/6-carboxytetrahydropterin synthase